MHSTGQEIGGVATGGGGDADLVIGAAVMPCQADDDGVAVRAAYQILDLLLALLHLLFLHIAWMVALDPSGFQHGRRSGQQHSTCSRAV